MNRKRFVLKQYIILIIATGVVLWIYLILNHAQAYEFISFDKDKAVNNFIYRILQENNTNNRLGLIEFLFFCEFNLQNIAIYLINLVVKDAIFAINIYYILSFFFISCSMHWLVGKFHITSFIAIYISVFAAFIPYHTDRGEGQIITSSFFMVPLFMGIVYELLYQNYYDKFNIKYFMVLLLAPFIDIRLSVMMLVLVLILIVHAGKRDTMKRVSLYIVPLFISLICVSVLTGIFGATGLEESIQIARDEGLRLCDMIMPLRYHIWRRLSDFRVEYDVMFQASGESGLNSMGILLTICFIISLFSVFFFKQMDKKVLWMSWINIIVILIANTRGFNLIFEYFGIHILYWNRMAIVILVNSMVIMAIFLQMIYLKVKYKGFILFTNGIYLVIGILGMFELLLRQNM